jgi:hypothetical protein
MLQDTLSSQAPQSVPPSPAALPTTPSIIENAKAAATSAVNGVKGKKRQLPLSFSQSSTSSSRSKPGKGKSSTNDWDD